MCGGIFGVLPSPAGTQATVPAPTAWTCSACQQAARAAQHAAARAAATIGAAHPRTRLVLAATAAAAIAAWETGHCLAELHTPRELARQQQRRS
ncbi:hypothetical protein ACWCQZ_50450 [Streptomyces sp. NPDC002285]